MVESLSPNPVDFEQEVDVKNRELISRQCDALIRLLQSGLDNDADLSEEDRKVAEETIASLERQKEMIGGGKKE